MPRKKMLEKDKKSRLTLNINENLLQKIDKLLETKNIKRSAFIEKLFNEYINKKS
jgi:metal-responsive CopG/Arc/MetJ family transcriptional regulator